MFSTEMEIGFRAAVSARLDKKHMGQTTVGCRCANVCPVFLCRLPGKALFVMRFERLKRRRGSPHAAFTRVNTKRHAAFNRENASIAPIKLCP